MSTPFSLLCLVLAIDFHKNASFPPNMLNYLNMTFNVGKQIKHNFINRKVKCRPTCLFTHFRARVSYEESRGSSSPRMTGNISRSTALSDSSAQGRAQGGLPPLEPDILQIFITCAKEINVFAYVLLVNLST